jgi:hypothetical protein
VELSGKRELDLAEKTSLVTTTETVEEPSLVAMWAKRVAKTVEKQK